MYSKLLKLVIRGLSQKAVFILTTWTHFFKTESIESGWVETLNAKHAMDRLQQKIINSAGKLFAEIHSTQARKDGQAVLDMSFVGNVRLDFSVLLRLRGKKELDSGHEDHAVGSNL